MSDVVPLVVISALLVAWFAVLFRDDIWPRTGLIKHAVPHDCAPPEGLPGSDASVHFRESLPDLARFRCPECWADWSLRESFVSPDDPLEDLRHEYRWQRSATRGGTRRRSPWGRIRMEWHSMEVSFCKIKGDRVRHLETGDTGTVVTTQTDALWDDGSLRAEVLFDGHPLPLWFLIEELEHLPRGPR